MTPVNYQVALKIDKSIFNEFNQWLTDHIKEMLTLPGFIKAKTMLSHNILSKDGDDLQNNKMYVDVDDSSKGFIELTVIYKVENLQMMEEYFNVHAAKMRGDGVKRFGDKFSAERRVNFLNQTFS